MSDLTTKTISPDSAQLQKQPAQTPPKKVSSSFTSNGLKYKEYGAFLAFALPNIILILVFIYNPLLNNIVYSFTNWQLGAQVTQWVGFANYKRWFTDPASWDVMRITAIFAVATVGGTLILGMGIAMALNQKVKGKVQAVARSSVFAPYVLSGVGVGLVWLFIFDPMYGALAGMLKWFGINSPDWYQDRGWALLMVIIVYIWKNLGYAAIVYLAALQAINPSVLEAAEIDGATGFTRFRKIIFPLLSPTTFFLLTTTILNSLQAFDLIKIMTSGGPLNGTTTLMYQVYQEAFENSRAGYSAAVGTILFIILLGLTIFQMRVLEKKVHYS
ncbi:MAG: sugar ABC transporter permease [Micrococcaceae bacterium]